MKYLIEPEQSELFSKYQGMFSNRTKEEQAVMTRQIIAQLFGSYEANLFRNFFETFSNVIDDYQKNFPNSINTNTKNDD